MTALFSEQKALLSLNVNRMEVSVSYRLASLRTKTSGIVAPGSAYKTSRHCEEERRGNLQLLIDRSSTFRVLLQRASLFAKGYFQGWPYFVFSF
jgi:hypothetical protein